MAAPSLVVMTPVASLKEASPLATPLVIPPFEPPVLVPLPDVAPVASPETFADPELEPVTAGPLPVAAPAPDPVVEAPLLALLAPLPVAPAPALVVPFSAGTGTVGLALQAAATKAAQKNPCDKDRRLTPISVGGRAIFDHPTPFG
jgi:hypothetical protein